ncbi:hypothetical protein BDV93DRAFT_261591 [Ceratobasidium sp. AG-I]|nr:hypothetical protein BDV93DRAFT_261591 [Ceratobasidium sp. AG-I]
MLQILSELWYPEITTGRYTMALCGATLVSLASLSLIQSWPRGLRRLNPVSCVCSPVSNIQISFNGARFAVVMPSAL